VSTLLATRDAGDPLPAGAFVISPWVDLEATRPSIARNARYDYIDRATLQAFARNFVGRADLRNPLAAPVHADLRGLPPLLVQAGGAEALLDDAHALATRARAAGVDVTFDVEPEMIHAWPLLDAIVPCARGSIERLARFARTCTPDA
jgi:monoterpene epsilon-lactone hydrolase